MLVLATWGVEMTESDPFEGHDENHFGVIPPRLNLDPAGPQEDALPQALSDTSQRCCFWFVGANCQCLVQFGCPFRVSFAFLLVLSPLCALRISVRPAEKDHAGGGSAR